LKGYVPFNPSFTLGDRYTDRAAGANIDESIQGEVLVRN
jgi:hypothetical protein